jgi:hypothetical protein
MRFVLCAALLATILLACVRTPTDLAEPRCEVRVDAVEPAVLDQLGGEWVTLTGRGFTDERDMLVRLAGEDLVVDEVQRTDCAACDACLFPNDGAPCGDCRAVCLGVDDQAPCVETLSFWSPPLDAGTEVLFVVSRVGMSEPFEIEVQ